MKRPDSGDALRPAGLAPRPDPTPPPSLLRRWLAALRPRTLTLALTPALVGAALAWADGAPYHLLAFVEALLAAALIQAGTNLHNDASDFLRGNDGPARLGPLRVTAAGWLSPRAVQGGARLCFLLALVLGIDLVRQGGIPILLIGLASLAAGMAYSGGPRPISHSLWGEVFVLVFFGVVAVVGSHYLQSGGVSPGALLAGLALGAMAAAVLLVNNTRDLVEDRCAGRRTLAAWLGEPGARRGYRYLMLLPFLLPLGLMLLGPVHPGQWLVLGALPKVLALCRAATAAQGRAWNPILAGTAQAQALFGVLLALGSQWP